MFNEILFSLANHKNDRFYLKFSERVTLSGVSHGWVRHTKLHSLVAIYRKYVFNKQSAIWKINRQKTVAFRLSYDYKVYVWEFYELCTHCDFYALCAYWSGFSWVGISFDRIRFVSNSARSRMHGLIPYQHVRHVNYVRSSEKAAKECFWNKQSILYLLLFIQ